MLKSLSLLLSAKIEYNTKSRQIGDGEMKIQKVADLLIVALKYGALLKALEEKNDGMFDYRGKSGQTTWSV